MGAIIWRYHRTFISSFNAIIYSHVPILKRYPSFMALRITGLGEEIAAVTGLPWHINLEQWPEDPSLAEKRGISRHIVRLVRSSDELDA